MQVEMRQWQKYFNMSQFPPPQMIFLSSSQTIFHAQYCFKELKNLGRWSDEEMIILASVVLLHSSIFLLMVEARSGLGSIYTWHHYIHDVWCELSSWKTCTFTYHTTCPLHWGGGVFKENLNQIQVFCYFKNMALKKVSCARRWRPIYNRELVWLLTAFAWKISDSEAAALTHIERLFILPHNSSLFWDVHVLSLHSVSTI